MDKMDVLFILSILDREISRISHLHIWRSYDYFQNGVY